MNSPTRTESEKVDRAQRGFDSTSKLTFPMGPSSMEYAFD